MRPDAIVTFERLGLLSIALATVQLVLQANDRLGAVGTPLAQIVVGGGVTALTVALVLLASRRRSNFARWIFTVVTLLGAAVTLYDLVLGVSMEPSVIAGLAAVGLQVAAVVMLFAAGTREWFSGGEVVGV